MDTPNLIYSRLLYDIWLQDGGTVKCSDDMGKQKEKKMCSGEQEAAERVGKIKITISQRAEILRRRPKASTKLVHICSTSKLPNCTLMWEGPSRPQQAFQRSLSIKKKSSVSPSTFAVACWTETVPSRNTHKGRTLLPNSSWLSEKSSQCFPHFLFAATLSPTVTAIWPAVHSGTLGEERGNSVCVREERWWVSTTFWLVYIHQREINST